MEADLSPEQLVASVLAPRKGLEFGTYRLTISGPLNPEPIVIRMSFHGDCVRTDTYGQADKIHSRQRDGTFIPFEAADPATSVFRESWCDGASITYNPVRSKSGRRFSVAVKHPYEEADPTAALERVRLRTLNPRLVGLQPAQAVLLASSTYETVLCDAYAVARSVKEVERNHQKCLQLSQALKLGQEARHWIRPDQSYSVCAADITSSVDGHQRGSRVEIETQEVPTPTGMLWFPRQIEVFESIDNQERLIFLEDIDEVDFVTPIDPRIFTVEGMGATEGTHVATSNKPGQIIHQGKPVPWRPEIESPPAPPPPPVARRSLWVALNVAAIAAWIVAFLVWRRSSSRRP